MNLSVEDPPFCAAIRLAADNFLVFVCFCVFVTEGLGGGGGGGGGGTICVMPSYSNNAFIFEGFGGRVGGCVLLMAEASVSDLLLNNLIFSETMPFVGEEGESIFTSLQCH
jgi:hypothetical protein